MVLRLGYALAQSPERGGLSLAGSDHRVLQQPQFDALAQRDLQCLVEGGSGGRVAQLDQQVPRIGRIERIDAAGLMT